MNTIKLNNLNKATSISFVVFIYLAVISALSLYILNTTPTHADTTSATASVTVPSACTLTSTITSGNAHSTTMVAGTLEEDIGTTNLKAICNDPDGLDIYAVGYSSNTLGNTNLVGDNGLNIATGLNTSSSTGNGNSNWAMKLFFPASTDPNANTVYQPNILSDTNGSYAEYHIIPATSTKVASFNAVTDTVVGSNLNTTYRIYLEQNQPAGTYIGQVKYTITHPNTSFSLYMQDFTPEMCNTLGTAVTKTVTLYDKRDENSYTVTYINGQCWMTQNLRITGTISSAESNFSGADVNISQEDLAMDTPGNTFCLSSDPTACNTYDIPMTHESVDSAGNPSVWYNYAAVTAGTVTGSSNTTLAARDICPLGWRLPTGPNTISGTDFNILIGNTTDGSQELTSGAIAFNPVNGGDYYAGALTDEYGHWWSASPTDEASQLRRFALVYDENWINGVAPPLRDHGYFVRCVLETRDITATSYMQDINRGMVRNTAELTSATLTDRRDTNTYAVKKINGQLWMTQNLRLAGENTIYKSDSNISLSSYTLPTESTAYFNETTGFTTAGVYCSNNQDYGCYYNYAAATAETIVGAENTTYANDDICPIGWHLPNSSNAGATSDLARLIGNTQIGWQAPTDGLTSFAAVASGAYNYGNPTFQTNGYWWTKRSSNSTYRFTLIYNSSDNTYAGDGSARRFSGVSIRCVHD